MCLFPFSSTGCSNCTNCTAGTASMDGLECHLCGNGELKHCTSALLIYCMDALKTPPMIQIDCITGSIFSMLVH